MNLRNPFSVSNLSQLLSRWGGIAAVWSSAFAKIATSKSIFRLSVQRKCSETQNWVATEQSPSRDSSNPCEAQLWYITAITKDETWCGCCETLSEIWNLNWSTRRAAASMVDGVFPHPTMCSDTEQPLCEAVLCPSAPSGQDCRVLKLQPIWWEAWYYSAGDSQRPNLRVNTLTTRLLNW